MKKERIVPGSGFLLYLHILPRHFGRDFVGEFGPETFTFIMNCSHPQPQLRDILAFSGCGALKTAMVVSITPTATGDFQNRLTTHDLTVHAHLTDDIVMDVPSMHKLINKRGWRFLGTDGKIHTHH